MLDSGELVVDPITDSSIQPASIDCRIGSHYLVVAKPWVSFPIVFTIKFRQIIFDLFHHGFDGFFTLTSTENPRTSCVNFSIAIQTQRSRFFLDGIYSF
jgi:hypothetical protein